jgi:hypothetical protein
MFDLEDPNINTVRIEITRVETVYLYYKQYPKESDKFPKDRSLLVFYFNNELVTEKVLYEYFSLVKKPEKIALGSFFNKKGSKKKRKVVYYAIVRFEEPITIDKTDFQIKINEYLETHKNRKLLVEFNPLREDNDNIYDDENFGKDEVDEDGFITIKANNTNKSRFVSSTNKELSFGVIKDEEDSFMDEIKLKRKRKRNIGGIFKNKKDLEDNEDEDKELEEVYGKTNKGFWNVQQFEKQKKGIFKYFILIF